MQYGIVNLSLIPVRADKTDKSEMVNQLLFGDTIQVIRRENKWLKIKNNYDGYEGWVDAKQIQELSAPEFNKIKENNHYHLLDIHAIAQGKSGKLNLVMGATLPQYKETTFLVGDEKFKLDAQVVSDKSFKVTEKNIEEVASAYLDVPYLWGGRSPFGIDCSGYTQMVFKFFGIKLNRDAYQQAEQGRAIDFVENAQMGDLAFFHNESKKIVHVGILLRDKKIIHASGKVRIDIIDHHGIYNREIKGYTHYLSFIKRVV